MLPNKDRLMDKAEQSNVELRVLGKRGPEETAKANGKQKDTNAGLVAI